MNGPEPSVDVATQLMTAKTKRREKKKFLSDSFGWCHRVCSPLFTKTNATTFAWKVIRIYYDCDCIVWTSICTMSCNLCKWNLCSFFFSFGTLMCVCGYGTEKFATKKAEHGKTWKAKWEGQREKAKKNNNNNKKRAYTHTNTHTYTGKKLHWFICVP